MQIILTRDDLRQEKRHLDINDVTLDDFKKHLNVIGTSGICYGADVITFKDGNSGMSRDIKNRWVTVDFKFFTTKVEGFGEEEYVFKCFNNTEHIEIGDIYIYFFDGIADVQICDLESTKKQINKNEIKSLHPLSLVEGFWQNCYKICSTNFPIEILKEEI